MATQIKSPFKFLDAYDKEDKDIFFGRTQETYELYDRIRETNLVLLYGASGTGKTSLINCGLGNQFESTDWHPIFIRRQEGIMKAMQTALHEHAIKKTKPGVPLVQQVRSLYMDYFKPIYLIFDQFEEIFILGSKEEQQDFFEAIYQLLESDVQCKVLISMREEYIAHLSEYEDTIPYLFDNRLRVEKMNTKSIKDVIEGTAEKFDIELKDDEQEVSDLIIKRLRDKNHEIDLAYLQVYLDRLYRMDVDRGGQPGKVVFDRDLISKTGDLEDVMSEFLDEQIALLEVELAERYRDIKKGVPMDVLFELVTNNGTKQPEDVVAIQTRLSKTKEIPPGAVEYCVQRFEDMRIIRQLS